MLKDIINSNKNQIKKNISQLFIEVFTHLIDTKNDIDLKIVSSLTSILVSQVNAENSLVLPTYL